MLESFGPLQFGLVVLILITAYTFRGVTGFGSGLIAIPLLVLILPISIVIPTMVLLDFIASVSHSIKHREVAQWKAIYPLLPFTVIGVLIALFIFKTVDTNLLVKSLGIFILLFALYSLFSPTPHRQGGTLWAVPAGILGGMVGTLFGTGGPFYVIYLQLRHLDKATFRATVATIFMIDGGWESFQDLDPILPVDSFPAWLLLSRPGLIPVLPEPAGKAESERAVYPQSYLTLYRLRRNHARPATGAGDDGMALRARLKEQDPLLFQHFLDALAT